MTACKPSVVGCSCTRQALVVKAHMRMTLVFATLDLSLSLTHKYRCCSAAMCANCDCKLMDARQLPRTALVPHGCATLRAWFRPLDDFVPAALLTALRGVAQVPNG